MADVIVSFDIFERIHLSKKTKHLDISMIHMNGDKESFKLIELFNEYTPLTMSVVIKRNVYDIIQKGYNVHYTQSRATPYMLKFVDALVPDFKTATSMKYKIHHIEMKHTFNFEQIKGSLPDWYKKHWSKVVHFEERRLRLKDHQIKPSPPDLTKFSDKELATFYLALITSLNACLDEKSCTVAKRDYMKSIWDPAIPILNNFNIYDFIKSRKGLDKLTSDSQVWVEPVTIVF